MVTFHMSGVFWIPAFAGTTGWAKPLEWHVFAPGSIPCIRANCQTNVLDLFHDRFSSAISSHHPGLVCQPVRRAYRRPGRRVAGHRPGAPYPDCRAHRLRQDFGRLPGLHRPAGAPGFGRRAARRYPGRLRFAPEGAVQRRAEEPGCAVGRNPGPGRRPRPAIAPHQDRRSHRRHSGVGTAENGETAAPTS